MTFEEMKAIANKTTTRKKSRHIESQIQQSCVKWFKTEEKGSTQRETQKQWQKAAEAAGNKYVICRSFDDFRKEVISYLFPKK